jgi:UDP-N-acetyl-2-amino-2-deoxyglucuronate dehydrogenase
MIGDEEFDFSAGFTDLHTTSYEHILLGQGFRSEEARKSIQLVYEIRNARELSQAGDQHPLVNLAPTSHPFSRSS